MLAKLYPYRLPIFFFSQLAILFGSLVIPAPFFEGIIAPIIYQVNLLAGILLVSKKKKMMWFLVILLVVTGIVFGSSLLDKNQHKIFNFLEMGTYFLFYVILTVEIIKQVWRAQIVNKNVIFGLISGYISLGLIGFFICLSIEMAYPNSFRGIVSFAAGSNELTENLLYYSYITLLTIGYGDIIPITSLAHKAAILIGLMGQFYLVIITAIVVGKHVSQGGVTNDRTSL